MVPPTVVARQTLQSVADVGVRIVKPLRSTPIALGYLTVSLLEKGTLRGLRSPS